VTIIYDAKVMSDILNRQNLQKLIGRECVYYEKAFFHVVVAGLKVDGDQLLLGLRQIPSVGFSTRDLELFEVSCVAEYLSISPNSIQASMVNWALVINEKATQQLVLLAAVTTDPSGLLEEYKRLRRTDFESLDA
jgi:hypothetical protein